MINHPNVMLILALTPDDLARKTYRAILTEAGSKEDENLQIGAYTFTHHGVMESDYDENFQLSLPEGSIYFCDLVTYGYGDKKTWETIEQEKQALAQWAQHICERHHCTANIFLSANYW